jgi:hypothetical protein
MIEKACVQAIDRSGLVDARIAEAIDSLLHHEFSNASLIGQVSNLTRQLDDIAWDLQERVEKEAASKREYETAFARARASAAVGFAMQDTLNSAFDALYEAYFAINVDTNDFVRSLTS